MLTINSIECDKQHEIATRFIQQQEKLKLLEYIILSLLLFCSICYSEVS